MAYPTEYRATIVAVRKPAQNGTSGVLGKKSHRTRRI
jgi:hypothetical protein